MKQNTINYYKNVLKNIENPKGNDTRERKINKEKALKNKANLEERYPFLTEDDKDKKDKKEVKKDGKKSKG